MMRDKGIIIFSGVLLILLCLLSLKCGTVPLTWQDVGESLLGKDGYSAIIIKELRLPRLLAALFCGAALAGAGLILQKVLHNDLASPDILGISGGAGCAGLILLLCLPLSLGKYLNFAAFSGALLAAMLIYLAAWKRELAPVRLILAGVAMGAIFSTVSGAVLLLNSDKFVGVMEFAMGGFSRVTMTDFYRALPFFLLAFAVALTGHRRWELLTLGDDEAFCLGLPVNFSRFLALFTAALLAATAVSLAGLLGFAGLMAPHIAGKMLKSSRVKTVMIFAMLIGSLLCCTGDLLGRILFAPRELPCGLFLTGTGAVFFLILLWRQKGGDR
ncbi:MAG: iron ABC transporter permease [Lentisphaeria bacterium]|nr:iron ABC transporter permease [Lentisphaeria bacterium]